MPPTSKQRQIKEIVKCGKDPVTEAFNNNRFNVVLKSRQLGLSTLAAAYAVWLAVFYKDKSVLVIATKLAVAINFIRKVKIVLNNMPKWLLLPKLVENNKQSVLFSNGR